MPNLIGVKMTLNIQGLNKRIFTDCILYAVYTGMHTRLYTNSEAVLRNCSMVIFEMFHREFWRIGVNPIRGKIIFTVREDSIYVRR